MILDSKNKEGHEVSTLDNLEQDTVDKNPAVYCAFMFKIFWEFCGCGLIIDRNYLA
jgi:hypothetical protein